MRVLLVMKRQISWLVQDLNIRSQDPNQLAASQSELSKKTPLQIVVDRWSHLRNVPRRRWISHTYPMWLWAHSLFKNSPHGPVLYGTKWLLW
jgi:hypothetical protein